MTAAIDFLPDEQRDAMAHAARLEWWNVGWTLSIILVMGLVLGQSQTMKTAWVEDTLGLIPPIAILISLHVERRWPASARFPFGFHRVNGLGFFVAAVALTAVGGLLLWDSGATLASGEHATVASVRLFGRDLWLGWLMLAAQFYSLLPPLFIGRKELPLAEKLNDKLIHTDALMNKANWLTGAAGFAGVLGLGLGWWWADSVAAIVISFDILHDGITALRSATAELIDGAPRGLGDCKVSKEANALHDALDARFPGTVVRVRETGRLIRAEVIGAEPPEEVIDLAGLWPGDADCAWRFSQLSFTPKEGSSLLRRQGDGA